MTYTVRELAAKLNLPFQGDGDRAITRAGSWASMDEGCLIFLERGGKFALAPDRAPGCLLAPEDLVPTGMTALISDRPKLDFARAHALLSPRPRGAGRRHPSARVAPDAVVAEDVDVGPYAVVGPCATIGRGSVLHAGVVVGESCVVGAECILYPRVVLYPAVTLGDRVTLHAGVVAGSDGFGYVFDGRVQIKFPQSGNVIIEDDVEIGANTTIDRGSLGTTRIRAGAKIDNLVQIAHNVEIGRGVVIAAQTGISGSSVIEDYAVIGGQVGFGDHTRVESGAIIGSKAGILPGKIVRGGEVYWGVPIRPLREYKRLNALFGRLPEMKQQLDDLKSAVARLEEALCRKQGQS
jgi:UDP-3-O-[3-hydroxymyristoyl] glucosamine N-acyltransferase